jgi:threonine synthase
VRITLGEGNTPLVPSARIAPALSFKLEFTNPTGSYKDRFLQRELSSYTSPPPFILATSSGNTGASLAAYAARAGWRCLICAHPEAPAGKVTQMRAHGATVVRIPGFTVDAGITAAVFADLERWRSALGVPLVVSAYRYCPVGMAGVETIAGELAAQSAGALPQHVFAPVGGGGLYVALVRGFARLGLAVKVHAVQPAGCATVVEAWRHGRTQAVPLASTTRISGLSVPSDIDATLALEHLYGNGGLGLAVTDEAVWSAQQWLLREEGIFAEPAGAAALAGWLQATAAGRIPAHERAVCLVTGYGAKDMASLEAAAARIDSPLVAAADLSEFLRRQADPSTPHAANSPC